MNPYLRRGDIVFVMSDGLVGWLIRKIEARGALTHTYVNHVALVTHSGPIYPHISDSPESHAMILDAQPPHVSIAELAKYQGDLISVYRPRNLSSWDKDRICDYAVDHYAGHLYGVGKILLHILGLSRWARIDAYPICSWTVARSFDAIKRFTFGGSANEATPETMYEFCRANPDKYEEIVRLGILEPGRVREKLLAASAATKKAQVSQ